MSENSVTTKMCSVMVADVAGFSGKTNAEQAALKTRFVSMWEQATKEAAHGEAITGYAGDGVTMVALDQPEDTVRVALKLRELAQLDREKPGGPMLLRMGINFGPVGLSTDEHGSANVVGDAISIAQHIMSFAEPGEIEISHDYYDVILPLSGNYHKFFRHIGPRVDDHLRLYDVYGSVASGQAASPGQASETLAPQHDAEPNKIWGRLSSLLKGVFSFIKFALLLLVIYELGALLPDIRDPDKVRVELERQKQAVGDIWAGLHSVVDDIRLQISGQEGQPAVPAADDRVGKGSTDKVNDAHN